MADPVKGELWEIRGGARVRIKHADESQVVYTYADRGGQESVATRDFVREARKIL